MTKSFLGSDEFPIEWEDGQENLFWVHDDLHIPNPVSPMYADIGGWWLTCDYMFRRFGTPFAADWIVKIINGYVYTAAIPADSNVTAVGHEYGSKYVARTPVDNADMEPLGAYLNWTLPYYADNFLDWWSERIIPDMENSFRFIDNYNYGDASLLELAVLLEDMIDIHHRHWQTHWVLNFSQFSATMALNAAIEKWKGEGDHGLLMGRLQASTENRNWDAIEGLWKMKEAVKSASEDVKAAFTKATAPDVIEALKTTDDGRAYLREHLDPYIAEFGYKSMWAHELCFKTWKENPAPAVEAVRGYLETDYSFPADIKRVAKDLEDAKAEVLDGVTNNEGRKELSDALELSLKMNPLTPDHHFYIDQGTNARLRLVLIEVGKKLLEQGALLDAEDIMYLRYNELRAVMAGSFPGDHQELISDRRDDREDAYHVRPPDWVGTATEDALAFPYLTLWGFPEKYHREPPQSTSIISGLPASSGVVEGVARVVISPDEFDQVQKGEIAICRMTSPAWVVLFTRIGGLVTDAGGMASHPAVVSREFAIPAVVGTSDATRRIKTGDLVRVNGSVGQVDILDGVSVETRMAV